MSVFVRSQIGEKGLRDRDEAFPDRAQASGKWVARSAGPDARRR